MLTFCNCEYMTCHKLPSPNTACKHWLNNRIRNAECRKCSLTGHWRGLDTTVYEQSTCFFSLQLHLRLFNQQDCSLHGKMIFYLACLNSVTDCELSLFFFSTNIQIDGVNTSQFHPKKKVSERCKAWTEPFYKHSHSLCWWRSKLRTSWKASSFSTPREEQLGEQWFEERNMRENLITVSSLEGTPHCPTPSQFLVFFHPITTSDFSSYPGDTTPQGSNASSLLSAGTRHQIWTVISPRWETGRAAGRQKDVQGGRCFQDLPVAWWVERF